MENLPELVIRNISKYLSVKDLGACCSTSTSWRDVFNQDHVWRLFCDQVLASHLKGTTCQVEPRFVSPELEDSSLNPICEWRLSYMREVHLWNNWKKKRYKKEFIGSIRHKKVYKNHFFQFISSNLMLIKLSNEKRVMLWDVKETSIYLYDPVSLKFGKDIHFCEIIEDTIIFVQMETIQIYKINHSTNVAWEPRGIYNLSSRARNIFIASHSLVVWNLDDIIEILDLKSCEAVRISKMPRDLTDSRVYRVENGGKGSTHFIVMFKCETYAEQESDNSVEELFMKQSIFIYLYSIEKLAFIDFNVTISVVGDYLDCSCRIHEEFLTVFNNGSIKVYRYLTSELVLDAPYAFTSSITRHLLPNFQFPFLSLYRRDCTDKFDSGDFSVFFINSHQCSGLSPLVRHYLGFKSYDIARLLRHVSKYLALPKDVAAVGEYTYNYRSAVTNYIYTKCIDRFGPYIVHFW